MGDRLEVEQRIVGHLLVEQRVDHNRTGARHEQRMAVARCPGRLRAADESVRPGPVLDHHRGLQYLTEHLPDHARGDIGLAAGGEGHDDANGPGWPGSLAGGHAAGKAQQGGRERTAQGADRCVFQAALAGHLNGSCLL
ncbi:hypothetical protein D3C87_1336890 [compost metagenome]